MRLNVLHFRSNHIPVHTGHLVVDDHRIHRVRKKQLQPFVSAGRFENLVAVFFEQHLATKESVPVVVNAQNCSF